MSWVALAADVDCNAFSCSLAFWSEQLPEYSPG